MPVATAPLGVCRAPAPARTPQRARPPLRVVQPPRRRRPRPSARRTVPLSVAFVVGSLLAVVGADAYLTQGQVRLTRLQLQLNAEVGHHHDLELKVAQFSNPGAVVSGAQRHGMQGASQVADIPLVSPPTTAPGGSSSTASSPSGAPVPAASATSGTKAP